MLFFYLMMRRVREQYFMLNNSMLYVLKILIPNTHSDILFRNRYFEIYLRNKHFTARFWRLRNESFQIKCLSCWQYLNAFSTLWHSILHVELSIQIANVFSATYVWDHVSLTTVSRETRTLITSLLQFESACIQTSKKFGNYIEIRSRNNGRKRQTIGDLRSKCPRSKHRILVSLDGREFS